jgi:hypothetical protein
MRCYRQLNGSDFLMDKAQNRWDEIAWNGISFYKPATWEIATIGRNYMMIGTHAHPRMEITWENAHKPVLRQRNIKKLQQQIRKQHLTAVDSWTPSHNWLQALTSFETTGFSWNRPEKISRGLIVSCLSCQRVSLIQFFNNPDEPDKLDEVAPRVLSTFVDHANGDEQRWAVFDIRAALPTVFQIKRYQFSPGFMEMVFFSSSQQISLYRWSPASVLLSGKKLTDFAESLRLFPDRSAITIPDCNRLEWEHFPTLSLWNRFSTIISGRYSHHRILIRHDTGNNRILAIKAESKQMMDLSRLDRIFSSYEIATV